MTGHRIWILFAHTDHPGNNYVISRLYYFIDIYKINPRSQPMKKKAACYIRVSTDEQTELSPSSQLEALKEYADAHGYIIPKEYVFKDEGISGRTTQKRPGFNRMIAAAKTVPKPFEAVLLWKFSRFARNRTDAIVYKNLLRNELGIDVISISENLGEDRGTALILESMFEAMDEYYSINLSTEVRRSMKLKAEKGQPLSTAPFGYRTVDKQLVIDSKKAETVKYIFNAFENGEGTRKIAAFLGDCGVRTNRGCVPDNRFVSYILKNPVYCGYTRWCENGRADYARKSPDFMTGIIIAKGTHEPIISEEQFNRVQTAMKEAQQQHRKHQSPKRANDWLFKGLITCDSCGSTLVKLSSKEQTLQCNSYNRGTCSVSHYLSVQKASKAIIEQLERVFKELDFIVICNTVDQAERENSAVLQRAIDSEKAKLKRVREAFEAGIDSLEEFRENKKRILSNIDKFENDLQKCETAALTENGKADSGTKTVDLFTLLCDERTENGAKNLALRSIIRQVIFYKPQNELRVLLYL